LARNTRAGERPRDGYFTEFWRLLLKYPEALAWENLWATSRHESHCTPEGVAQAVKAAFKGGAGGIILSRNFTETKPENLSGAGKALRELGVI
jgi:hypothetical protein